MAEQQDAPQRSARFAPRERSGDAGRQTVRTSLIFIGIGAALSMATVLWLGLFSQRSEIRLDISEIKVDESGDVELTGAVYRGTTEGGEPYEITAEVASERQNGVVDLAAPAAFVNQTGGDVVNLTSRSGVYFPDRDEINFAGDVVITSRDTGLVMTSQAITANLDDGDMTSTQPVRVENDSGVAIADSMQVLNRGKLIIFTGNPRLTLQNVGAAQ
jgi:lipopolysaccharide export system protein LptC